VGEEQARNAKSTFINIDNINNVLAKSAIINLTESIAELWHRRLVYINNNDIQKL
jgi:cobalamin-dependent methionine synthase I